MNTNEKQFILLSGLFIGLLITANILATKIIVIPAVGFELFVPAAVFCYALTFLLSDTISELFGRERANWVVLVGFFASFIVAIVIRLAIWFPPAPYWEAQAEFEMILGANLRITIAGMIAYMASQYHDIWAFHVLKRMTKDKHLWLRNTVSTLGSQLIDTVLFITIAFYGIAGMNLGVMIGSQYVVKVIIALLDTPLVYLLLKLLRPDHFRKGFADRDHERDREMSEDKYSTV